MKKYRCNITFEKSNRQTISVGAVIDDLQYNSLSMQEQRNFKILTQ